MAQLPARQFIAVCAACLLAACGGTQRTQAPSDPATTSVREAPQPPATAPQEAPRGAAVRSPVRSVPEPDPDPEILIGLASDAVDKLLGEPELVRHDGPAEVRLYRAREEGCTFHVFLYATDGSRRSGAVEYFEARNQAGRLDGTAVRQCYRSLVRPAATS